MSERAAELFATTKFAAPAVPATYVARSALFQLLDDGGSVPITLVIGLPASGKTTLVTAWLQERAPLHAVWMSCDARDQDAHRLWQGLLHALRLEWPDRWTEPLDRLDQDDPEFSDVAIATVNELARLEEPVVVVIDDCQAAGSALGSLAELLERLPANVRFVLTARSRVELPLQRMRVHGVLQEIRQDALRLAPSEVAALLDRFEITLSVSATRLLVDRTEGWMAGVYLAALSLQGLDDPESFVREFSGSSRAVTDYLTEEVLDRQSPDLREFLIETSVLAELDGALCAEVTGRANAPDLLRRAERENLFLVTSVDQSTSRYHELFADLLQLRLRASDPGRATELHRRAARALEQRNKVDQALRHWLAAGDDAAALALLRDRLVRAVFVDEGSTIEQWLDEVRPEWIAETPERMLQYALAAALGGRAEDGRRWVHRAKDSIDQPGPLSARVEIASSLVEAMLGDATAAVEHARQAVELADPATEPLLRALPVVTVYAHQWLGNLEGARRAFADSQRLGTGDPAIDQVTMPAACSWVAVVEGCLGEAEALADQALDAARRLGIPRHSATVAAYRTKGWVCFEDNDLDGAERLLEESLTIAECYRPPFALVSAVAQGWVWQAGGRLDDALEMARRARSFLLPSVDSPLFDLVDELEGTIALTMHDLQRAVVHSSNLREPRRRVVFDARIALAGGDFGEAHRLLQGPAGSPRTLRELVRDRVLGARCAVGLESDDAGALIGEATELASSEGLLGSVLEELKAIPDAARSALRPSYGTFAQRVSAALDRSVVLPPEPPRGRRLPEPLSPQELKVLRYMGARLTQREIAGELYVSLNTLKTHAKAIYRKLDVGSRADAIERARHLELI